MVGSLGGAVAAQIHVSHGTHDHTTTAGSPTDLNEVWADVKSAGGLPGNPVGLGATGGRFIYKVGSIDVVNTAVSPMFSGQPVAVHPSLTTFQIPAAANFRRQVAILQRTDAFEVISNSNAQAYFYGAIPNPNQERPGFHTNARAISVWPSLEPEDTRIAICGECNDQRLPLSQDAAGWTAWSSSSPRYSGFIAVYDGNCTLRWSDQFYGRAEDGDCAITDVSIRVVGEGETATEVVTYCGISSHGVALSGGLPTTANAWLTPENWFDAGLQAPGAFQPASGKEDNGVGQWDGFVGRLTNSFTAPTTGSVSNAMTSFHAVVGGRHQDGLFGLAEMEDDRFVVVGSSADVGSTAAGQDFPYTVQIHAWQTLTDFCVATALVFDASATPGGALVLEAADPMGHVTGERSVARDVFVQLDAVRADPQFEVADRTHVIYVVGSTNDSGFFDNSSGITILSNPTVTSQTSIGGGNDGFLLAARDMPGNAFVDFDKGSFHGGSGDDGLCGVTGWNEYLDHATVYGWTSGIGTSLTSVDLEVASYFADTPTPQTGAPVVVSDLLRIRRANVDATLTQVPAAMGANNVATAATVAWNEFGLGSAAGGGVAMEDRGRVNIVGANPQGGVGPMSDPLVVGGGRNPLLGIDAYRRAVDLVPDITPSTVGVGRTDGTGQLLTIVSGANGGTTPTAGLAPFGRQVGVASPATMRILLDWEGTFSNPAAVLVDRPPLGSNIVGMFLHYGIPGVPMPTFSNALLPGCELWMDPTSPFTTSITQFFGAGTDQSVRVSLTLPTTPGHTFVVQAIGVLGSGAAVASPGLVFRF